MSKNFSLIQFSKDLDGGLIIIKKNMLIRLDSSFKIIWQRKKK